MTASLATVAPAVRPEAISSKLPKVAASVKERAVSKANLGTPLTLSIKPSNIDPSSLGASGGIASRYPAHSSAASKSPAAAAALRASTA